MFFFQGYYIYNKLFWTHSYPIYPPISTIPSNINTFFLFSFSTSAYLHKANLTLRKALAYLDASIAVGLLVENWSAYPLSKPTIEIQEGKVLQENTSIPVPGSVKAGTMNAGIILQSKVKSI